MTVGELIEELKQFQKHQEVYVESFDRSELHVGGVVEDSDNDIIIEFRREDIDARIN